MAKSKKESEIKIVIKEAELQNLLPPGYKLEINEVARIVNVLSTDPPHIIAQQQFTKSEWSALISLLTFYPHYAPYESLLTHFTSFSLAESRKRIQEAQLIGSKALRQELKPVYRAISGIRSKLNNLTPFLKIALIPDAGYAITTSIHNRNP
jgi:hypothetical protein